MKIMSLEKLFEEQLKDLFSAEKQLVKALPRMAKAASGEALREAFTSHLEETKGHVERLEEISKKIKVKLSGKKCKAMEGLIEEGKEAIEADGPEGVIDAALIAAAQRVEHYEISAYGTVRTLAEVLDYKDVAIVLQKTLDEESAADEKLTQVCTEESLPAALEGDEEG